MENIKDKDIEKENIEKYKKLNIQQKKNLKIICSQIENIFENLENRKKLKLPKLIDNTNKLIEDKENKKFITKLYDFKDKIDTKKKYIYEDGDEYENIIKSENEYKVKFEKVKELKKKN